MNTVIISIGSNENSEENISRCKENLSTAFGEIHFSITSVTKPFGQQYKNDFLNQLALIYTSKEIEEVKKIVKGIEKKMGRKDTDKVKGLVKIDIDVVKWNEYILKEKDWHRSYVQELLPSLYKATITE